MTFFSRWSDSARYAVALTLALGAAACLQPSLNPLFLPEDSIFDERLLGAWTCGDETWTFTREEEKDFGPKPFYGIKVQTRDKGGELMAFVGKLDDNLFITFRPTSDVETPNGFFGRHLIGAYSFGQITIEPAKVRVMLLDSGWVEQTEKAGLLTIGIRRWPDDVVLTAAPKDLQRFARAYAGDERVFKEKIELVRPAPSSAATTRPAGSCYSDK